MAKPNELEETVKSLKRIQEIDAQQLSRQGEWGKEFNFSLAVAPAQRLIDLFRRIQVAALDDFPVGNLNQIRQQADAVFSLVDQIQKFKIEENTNPAGFRQQIVQQLTGQYDGAWSTLHPYIGYSAARTADFPRLESEGRAAVQSIADRTKELVDSLNATQKKAEEALAAAQRAAAEQGVSQQAVYFRDEALAHEKSAGEWRTYTLVLAVVVALYAVGSVLVHKWELLRPTNMLESAQLITSKILIFAVLSYVLILAARNFLSHKHNAIVNKHRQNALMTFNALAAAAKEQESKDIILTHAASCIFAPQETGYSKSHSPPDPAIARSMMSLIAKTGSRGETS